MRNSSDLHYSRAEKRKNKKSSLSADSAPLRESRVLRLLVAACRAAGGENNNSLFIFLTPFF
jgi:hypothetical protein